MVPSLLLALALAGSAQPPGAVSGRIVERIPCPSDPTQTYSLYLPAAGARHGRYGDL